MYAQLLAVEIAYKSIEIIEDYLEKNPDKTFDHLPYHSKPKHLIKLCKEIIAKEEEMPNTKLHRWLGFIQGVMITCNVCSYDYLKEIVREAKVSCGRSEDQVLADHHDPNSPFSLDLGGSG